MDSSEWSGWTDLNCRPHGPEPCALAWLSYTPTGKPPYGIRQLIGLSRRLLASSGGGYTAREATHARADALRPGGMGAPRERRRSLPLPHAPRLRRTRPPGHLRYVYPWRERIAAGRTAAR